MNTAARKPKLGSASPSTCAGLSIALAIMLTPHPARAQAVDTCTQELCLAGNLQGRDGGPVCPAAKQAYSSIRSFDAFGAFDPITTAYERNNELQTCSDFANEPVKAQITSELGGLFSVP